MKIFFVVLVTLCVFNNHPQNHINNNYTLTTTTITTPPQQLQQQQQSSSTTTSTTSSSSSSRWYPAIYCALHTLWRHCCRPLAEKKQSSLVTLPHPLATVPPPPAPAPSHCIVAAIYVHFCGFSSLSLPPSYAFSFSLSILRFMQRPPPSLCLPACHVRTPAPLLVPLPALFMLHAFDFVLLYFCCFFFLLLPISAWINSVFKCASCSCLAPSPHFPLAVCWSSKRPLRLVPGCPPPSCLLLLHTHSRI